MFSVQEIQVALVFPYDAIKILRFWIWIFLQFYCMKKKTESKHKDPLPQQNLQIFSYILADKKIENEESNLPKDEVKKYGWTKNYKFTTVISFMVCKLPQNMEAKL